MYQKQKFSIMFTSIHNRASRISIPGPPIPINLTVLQDFRYFWRVFFCRSAVVDKNMNPYGWKRGGPPGTSKKNIPMHKSSRPRTFYTPARRARTFYTPARVVREHLHVRATFYTPARRAGTDGPRPGGPRGLKPHIRDIT